MILLDANELFSINEGLKHETGVVSIKDFSVYYSNLGGVGQDNLKYDYYHIWENLYIFNKQAYEKVESIFGEGNITLAFLMEDFIRIELLFKIIEDKAMNKCVPSSNIVVLTVETLEEYIKDNLIDTVHVPRFGLDGLQERV